MQLNRRLILRGGCAAVIAALTMIGATEASSAKPTPPAPVPKPSGSVPENPTDAQLQAAASNKTMYATFVGVTNGRIAQTQIKLTHLQAVVELAEQKVALTHANALSAEQAAGAAKDKVTAANAKLATARAAYVEYIQSAYYGGTIGGTTGSVLTARNPSALLQASALEEFAGEHKLDAVSDMQTATIYKSNIDAKAQLAEQKAKSAEQAARTAVTQAQTAVSGAQTEEANLNATLAQQQDSLTKAAAWQQVEQNQRATYVSYQAKVAAYNNYLTQEQAYQKYQQQVAAAKLRAQQEAAAAAARARARAQQSGGSSSSGSGGGSGYSGGSGSGGGSGYSGGSSPNPPSGGSWTAAKGRQAVRRAESQLGVIYAWAGGNQYGPTRGVCAGDGAWNDCNVIGFDCSGLAMYAWGQGWVHYAATQYTEAGSYHPSMGNLLPGDLLFYSDGGISGIHHVAIYIGGGQIIQAPESGEVIEISSMYDPGTPFGATRPLS